MKYPIGIQSFEQIRTDGYVYVDKTDLIYSLVSEGKIYFLSRPRRFGKSLLVSTLENYFLGKKELFKGLAIDALEKEWNTYPIFHIDFSLGTYEAPQKLDQMVDDSLTKWEKQYQVERTLDDYGMRFQKILEAAHRQTGVRAVVLIDEYDKPILDVLDMDIKVNAFDRCMTLEDYHRQQLKSLYSTFKAADPDLQFVFLTGVTKFSQVSVFSGFNQPDDISMSPQYETLCGITEEEMIKTFAEPIASMANYWKCSFDAMVEMLKKRYDGYHFSDVMTGVFNPFSLLNVFKNLRMQDYWFKTGTPTYLVRLLKHSNENLNELTGKYYFMDQFADYKADVERPLPMIYQSGYLTIKDCDRDMGSFLLDFPNDEVKRGFVTLVANNYLQSKEGVDSWLLASIKSLKNGDLEQFHLQLTSFLASIPYSMRRKNDEPERERYFHYTFYLLLRLASVFITYTEKEQSQGRVDCILETDKYVYIFEFKLDGTADEALQQIEDKGYSKPYLSDSRQVFKIGANFSSETGTIEDWKVE